MIEYCINNGDGTVCTAVAGHPETRASACLGRCGLCHRDRFVVVDGEIRLVDAHEANVLGLSDGGAE